MNEAKDDASCKILVEGPEFCEFQKRYEKTGQEYLNGDRRKTAQFWMFYMDIAELQHSAGFITLSTTFIYGWNVTGESSRFVFQQIRGIMHDMARIT